MKADNTYLTDFAVEMPKGKDFVVLQISDPQIVDAGQLRFFDRLNPIEKAYWATENFEKRCYGYLREIIENTKPDLILITGDLVYGEFDDKGTSLKAFIEFMESFKILWCPIFGNHDNETTLGVSWQCDQLENAEHCLFKRGSVYGNGNYTVALTENGEIKRVFVMLDTHGFMTAMGLSDDQIEWYNLEVKRVKEKFPKVKVSFVMHVQPFVFAKALEKYGFSGDDTINNPIDIDCLENRADTDFGYVGAGLKNIWDEDCSIFENMKSLGADSIFVSHQHPNSASVMYEGVRLQYGQKSSTYDRANYITEDNKIVCSFTEAGTPIVGGSVFSLTGGGEEIVNPHIYYCKVSEKRLNEIRGRK